MDPSTFSENELKDMISDKVGPERVPRTIRLIVDTSDYFRVDYDDVVILGDRPYLIRQNEREGRFGIEEQQKFWVKRAIDLIDGSMKIIKLTFHERFTAKVGGLSFECYRSPDKEARILDLVRENPLFMHGISVRDAAGNLVRVIDYIRGKPLPEVVLGLGSDHQDYFYNYLPGVMDEFIELVEAIKFLHDHGEKHGDIRRDHIIKEIDSGCCKWIDFDFNYLHKESMAGYDLFGLGNIISYLVGRGDIISRDVRERDPKAYESLTSDDLNIIFNSRVVNLRKIYPYIPDDLNQVLLHFSSGAEVFYESTDEFLKDVRAARNNLR